MTSVESYLVAVIFTAIAGLSCGYGVQTLKLSNAKELGRPPATAIGLFGVLSIPVAFVYGIRWGLVVDGPHLIWVPALLAWLFAFGGGKERALQDKAVLVAWRLPLFGASIVVAAYHLFSEHMTV